MYGVQRTYEKSLEECARARRLSRSVLNQKSWTNSRERETKEAPVDDIYACCISSDDHPSWVINVL